MSKEAYSQLQQRVHYVRLDGDGDEEIRRFMDPATWTKAELLKEIERFEIPDTKEGAKTSNLVLNEKLCHVGGPVDQKMVVCRFP